MLGLGRCLCSIDTYIGCAEEPLALGAELDGYARKAV